MTFILRGRGSIWWSWCDFSWQAQHSVQVWEIAGARNGVFFNTKSSPRWDEEGPRSRGCEMTVLLSECRRIVVGLCSNRLSIGGSTSQICRWNLELRISWQAQYLVTLKGDFSCSAHCNWRFICHADEWWGSCGVAGAVFGEVGGCLLLRTL